MTNFQRFKVTIIKVICYYEHVLLFYLGGSFDIKMQFSILRYTTYKVAQNWRNTNERLQFVGV